MLLPGIPGQEIKWWLVPRPLLYRWRSVCVMGGPQGNPHHTDWAPIPAPGPDRCLPTFTRLCGARVCTDRYTHVRAREST